MRFPRRDGAKRQKWAEKVGRKAKDGSLWQPTGNHYICSDHFRPSDYSWESGKQKLKKTAIPSRFPTLARRGRKPQASGAVNTCAALGCTTVRNKTKASAKKQKTDLRFHSFPRTNPSLKRKWLAAMGIKEYLSSDTAFVCGKHFKVTDYEDNNVAEDLRTNAVPSVFPDNEEEEQEEEEEEEEEEMTAASEDDQRAASESNDDQPVVSDSDDDPDYVTGEEVAPVTRRKRGRGRKAKMPIKIKRTKPVKEKKAPEVKRAVPLDHSYPRAGKRARVVDTDLDLLPVGDLEGGQEKSIFPRRGHGKKEFLGGTLVQQFRTVRQQKEAGKTLVKNLKVVMEKGLLSPADFALMTGAFGFLPSNYSAQMLLEVPAGEIPTPELVELRNFCVALQCVSPAAYEHLQNPLSLPEPAVLRPWQCWSDGRPGFLTQQLSFAKEFAFSSPSSPSSSLFALLVQETKLQAKVSWCMKSQSYWGHSDLGCGPVEGSAAVSALTLMLVSLQGCGKFPLAYFLTGQVSSGLVASLVSQALHSTAEEGLLVKAVVTDGQLESQKAAAHLGFSLSPAGPTCFVPHPHRDMSQHKLWFLCDPALTLARTTDLLADRGTIYNRTQNGDLAVSWRFIDSLRRHQAGSRPLENKLWLGKQEPKQRTAPLSASVASALDRLREEEGLAQFQGCEETCRFIRVIDLLSSCLMARNPFATGVHAPLTSENRSRWHMFLTEAIGYLQSLYDDAKTSLSLADRTGAVTGLIVTATSLRDLTAELLEDDHMTYVLPYKLSLEHTRNFFRKVARQGNWRGSPTAAEFCTAMKSLASRRDLDLTLFADTDTVFSADPEVKLYSAGGESREVAGGEFEFESQAEQLSAALRVSDPDWLRPSLLLTARYICRCLRETVVCARCLETLQASGLEPTDVATGWPSAEEESRDSRSVPHGVLKVVLTCERAFKTRLPKDCLRSFLPWAELIGRQIETQVFDSLKDKLAHVFPAGACQEHFYEHELGVEVPHVLQLLKRIVSLYCRLRLHPARSLHQLCLALTARRESRDKTRSSGLVYSAM
ncbi:uncharacterized protein LOC101857889 isoform X2 [Aplysia californica]|uniref:Uncharacterized protein LOC101857889 isoform X2 n=1 Tax=Aplysia californica TaxID=6500 RepID=A0ABM0JV03_APLCA|nr:uncharacterized protein LOC101857889 isoform X2 [Aplysia californica]